MSITYTKRLNTKRIREPLFQKSRTKYRASRSSELENFETNLLKLDITRILIELSEIDVNVIEKIIYFIGDKKLITDEVKLDDGLSSELIGINLFFDKVGATEDSVLLESMDRLSSKMSRLFFKIKRLEIGN